LPHQVAVIYLLLQLLSAAVATMLSGSLERLARHLCPPDPTEALSKPVYLYEQAVDEAETALDLVEKEQARLVGLLPRELDELRPDELAGEAYQGRELHEACRSVADQCDSFIDRLMSQSQSHNTLERLISVRSRNELLIHLQDGCLNLLDLLKTDFSEPAAITLRHNLVEGLCAVLMVLEETLREGESADCDLLLTLTSDRAATMKSLREALIRADSGLGMESQARLLPATSLFERMIWLANRYAVLLARQSPPHPHDPQDSVAVYDR
jgi:phosphate:Na+ symporter